MASDDDALSRKITNAVSRALIQEQIEGMRSSLLRHGYLSGRYCPYPDRDKLLSSMKNPDSLRFAQLFALAHAVECGDVAGSVAEFGVYKGGFSRYIHHMFPGRKIYLFDTFSGFDERQKQNDRDKFGASPGMLDDAAVEDVARNVSMSLFGDGKKTPGEVIVKKGFFPASAAGVEDVFAFVSVDVDLYEPTRDGLEFFYPKLAKGGYIMIHDGINKAYPGCREAILEFCGKRNIPYVPTIDWYSSIIIAK